MSIRSTKQPSEIRSVLLDALAKEKVFILWQRNEDGSMASQTNAKLLDISEKSVLKFSLNKDVSFEEDKDIFFAVEDSTVVFKTDDIKLAGLDLYSSLPIEAKYKERRRHERKKFKTKERRDVEIHFAAQEQLGEEEVTIISQLIDISESGACILVSKETLRKIDAEKTFSIRSLTDLEIRFEEAKIMNARRYKGKTLNQGEFYALGVMFL
jgi:putative lipase involved disintegration of autophagic bodies